MGEFHLKLIVHISAWKTLVWPNGFQKKLVAKGAARFCLRKAINRKELRRMYER